MGLDYGRPQGIPGRGLSFGLAPLERRGECRGVSGRQAIPIAGGGERLGEGTVHLGFRMKGPSTIGLGKRGGRGGCKGVKW